MASVTQWVAEFHVLLEEREGATVETEKGFVPAQEAPHGTRSSPLVLFFQGKGLDLFLHLLSERFPKGIECFCHFSMFFGASLSVECSWDGPGQAPPALKWI